MVLALACMTAVLLFIVVGKTYNAIDWGKFWLNCLDGWMRLYCHKFHRLQSDACRLPESGCAILVSNHVSGLDPFLLLSASKRPLRFLMAVEEYERLGLQWLFRAVGCIPVERESRPEKAFRQAIKVLAQGEVLAIFPHGKIHLDSDPPRPLKRGAFKLAKLARAPVVAARIDGVGGEGKVVGAVIERSHAVVRTCLPLDASGDEPALIAQVSQFIGSPLKKYTQEDA